MKSDRAITVGWKVATLAFHVASVRYRALLPLIALEDQGVHFRLFRTSMESNLDELDVLVIVKSFTPDDLILAQAASRRGIRVLFDLCDNIFIETYTGKNGGLPSQMLQAMASDLDGVVVTTEPLAELVRRQLPDLDVFVIPDGIETPALVRRMREVLRSAMTFEKTHWLFVWRLKVRNVARRVRNEGVGLLSLLAAHVARRVVRGVRSVPRRLMRRRPGPAHGVPRGIGPQPSREPAAHAPAVPAASRVIVWFGNHGAPHARFGMLDLLEIREALEAAAREFDVELVVISNSREKYEANILPLAIRSRFVEWSPKAVEEWLRVATVTVIPNTLDSFSVCKSANRTVLSVTRSVPVVATRTPALDVLAEHVHLGDPLAGLRKYLSNPDAGRVDARRAAEVAQAVFGQPTIAQFWLDAIHRVARKLPRAEEVDPQCIVVAHLVQDLDLALPVLAVWSRENIRTQVWCSAGLVAKSPRVIASLDRAGIPHRIFPTELPGGRVVFPGSARVLLTVSETNLGPHRFTRTLTELARAKGLLVATLQHGFENVGLTYGDSVHAIDRITIKADRIYIWGGVDTLHPQVSPDIRAKCIPAGCPKPAVVEPADFMGLLPKSDTLIGIFENLHWHRYDDAYRAAFLEGVRRLAEQFPRVCFLVKPHHAGRWLSKLGDGERPVAPNLVVANPQAPAWERHTASRLLGHMSAVITTPSTVALDAARFGLPVAVFAQGLDLANYRPLTLLQAGDEWSDFIRDALDPDSRARLQAISARFVDRVLVPGDAAERIASELAVFARTEPIACKP